MNDIINGDRFLEWNNKKAEILRDDLDKSATIGNDEKLVYENNSNASIIFYIGLVRDSEEKNLLPSRLSAKLENINSGQTDQRIVAPSAKKKDDRDWPCFILEISPSEKLHLRYANDDSLFVVVTYTLINSNKFQ